MTAYKKSNSGYLPFVQKGKVSSPYTDIQNRAKIDSSLKCILGNERVNINSLRKITNEFGPNGEVVYEPDNGDSRIRFVGNWRTQYNAKGNSSTTFSAFLNPNEYVEVTFYGTGLNTIHAGPNVATDDINIEILIDGVVDQTKDIGNTSIVLNNRNYKANYVSNITSGLTLGWHTVKIRGAAGSQDFFRVHGFEIINENSQITVQSGKAHGNGYEYELSDDQLIDYNLGFDNIEDIDVGTKGGRAIVYLDPADGTVKKRFTKVDAIPAYSTSTDHTNEAPYRVINWREFGRNRADDFSTLSTVSDRVFTLDDGITTLVGDNVLLDGIEDAVSLPALNNFITLTFVGVGLDIINGRDLVTDNVYTVYVDGNSVDTLTGENFKGQKIKICSGLPYGTHTVKILCTTDNAVGQVFSDFIVYQPKKPTLPSGAIELADYNVMADYTFNNGVTEDDPSVGVIYKNSSREAVYKGSWSLTLDTGISGGFRAISSSTSGYEERNIYGTGFEYLFFATPNNGTRRISINGTDLTAANFPGVIVQTTSGLTYNPTTGDISGTPNLVGEKISVSGLDISHYQIRSTHISGANMEIDQFNIITPIHSPDTTFGSLSLKDVRNFDSTKDANKIIKIKNSNISFDSSVGGIDWSQNISQILSIATGFFDIYFEEVYLEDKPIVSVTSGQPVSRVSGSPEKHKVRVATTNNSDVGQLTHTVSVTFSGKLQKDELEE